MTYEEALDFFARYGNVRCDPDRLRETKPTNRQLVEASHHAINSHGQSKEVAEAAMIAICDHYNGEIE